MVGVLYLIYLIYFKEISNEINQPNKLQAGTLVKFHFYRWTRPIVLEFANKISIVKNLKLSQAIIFHLNIIKRVT